MYVRQDWLKKKKKKKMSKKIKQFGQVVRKDCFVLFTTSVQFNILICNSLSQFNNRACKQKE